MKTFEIISIEPTKLANYWVVSFKIAGGKIEKEDIEACDSNEAFIKLRTQAPKYLIKEDPGHRVIKTIAIAALILGVLYSFVKFGPTGDLSKTWTADDIPKATAYPK
jgi:hypothetical protein